MKRFILLIIAIFTIVSTAVGQNEPDYLCFEVTAGTTISITLSILKPDIQYSYDKINWNTLTSITMESDGKVYFKGVNKRGLNDYEGNGNSYTQFKVSKQFKCSGSVMSLIDGKGNTTTCPVDNGVNLGSCFGHLFENCPLTTAPKLPATKLTPACYMDMFKGCKYLTVAPELPATLTSYCYSGMFSGCTSLIVPPTLPATYLSPYCYKSMFEECTSLSAAPELPATILIDHCYSNMFYGCTNLTDVPRIAATEFYTQSYHGAEASCNSMFYGCEKLNTVMVNLTSWGKEEESWNYSSFYLWLKDVAPTGLFVCPKELEDVENHIPTGWKIAHYDDVFTITTSDNYVTIDKTSVEYDGVINFTVKERYNYKLQKVLVNGKEITITGKSGTINMRDYLEDIEIQAVYLKTNLTINNTSSFSSVESNKADEGDEITVSFTERPGYVLESAAYNNIPLDIENYQASFIMPANNVNITTKYSLKNYNIITDDYITSDKSTATINDAVSFSIADRSSEGYSFKTVLLNGEEFTARWFYMRDYMKDIELKAVYSTNSYSITTDEYCSVDKSSAVEGDVVTVSINKRDGYFVSVYNNGTWLTNDYLVSFTMPAEDVSIYTEYHEIKASSNYNVFTDQYSSTAQPQYYKGRTVTVIFSQRDGYKLVSATFNGQELDIYGYTAVFVMPDKDVTIVTEYKEIEKPEEKPIEYPITNMSEYVTVSTTSAKQGEEVTVFVSRHDGYTPHLFINDEEVIINNNVAKYIQPSAPVVITVEYQKDIPETTVDPKTAVTEVSGNNPAVSVYPNPARQGEKIVISIDSGIDLKNAKILIYNSHGALVKRIDHTAEYNETNLKSGIYNGVLIYKNGRQTFRIAVY